MNFSSFWPFQKSTTDRTLKRLSQPAYAPSATSFLSSLPVKDSWLTPQMVEMIDSDDTVLADKGNRKSGTLRKQLLIDVQGRDGEVISGHFTKIFHRDRLRQILDIPYQGRGIFELVWNIREEGYWFPSMHERDHRRFGIKEGELHFRGNGLPVPVEKERVAWTVYDAKLGFEYGRGLYRALYWPVKFRSADINFWHEFHKRFGTPWVFARGEEWDDAAREIVAEELHAMLGGSTAVITGGEIDLKMPERQADFENFVRYFDRRIDKIILGGNLSSEVSGGSLAATQGHLQIREDIVDDDTEVTLEILRQVIEQWKSINRYSGEVTLSLIDREEVDDTRAERDLNITRMGWRPTRKYIENTYGIQVEKAETAETVMKNSRRPHGMMAFSREMPQDTLEAKESDISTKQEEVTFLMQIQKALREAESYEAAQEALISLYPQMDVDLLREKLEHYLANTDLLGRAEIEDENPDG